MSSFAERRRQKRAKEAKKEIISEAYHDKLAKMKEIYSSLKENLQNYSHQYEHEIRNNKDKRAKFISICNKLDIDPIVSKKSMFGMLGDFYNQITIQILRICEKSKSINGGLMKIEELLQIFNRTYPSNQITRYEPFSNLARRYSVQWSISQS